MSDIHAVKEFIKMLVDAAVPIIKQIKSDGKFRIGSDVSALLDSEDFRKEFSLSMADFSQIPSEVKGMGMVGDLELAIALISDAKDVWEAWHS